MVCRARGAIGGGIDNRLEVIRFAAIGRKHAGHHYKSSQQASAGDQTTDEGTRDRHDGIIGRPPRPLQRATAAPSVTVRFVGIGQFYRGRVRRPRISGAIACSMATQELQRSGSNRRDPTIADISIYGYKLMSLCPATPRLANARLATDERR